MWREESRKIVISYLWCKLKSKFKEQIFDFEFWCRDGCLVFVGNGNRNGNENVALGAKDRGGVGC